MAFNGSGVFQRIYNWVNDAAANIKIRADRMDAEMDGFATGLSTCITKDGQTTITANLPMAGFRHTGAGNAAARTDYAVFGQVQDGKTNWVDGGGTADAITATYSIPITALVDGQICFVRATATNTTTTPTFSPNGLTARTIVKLGGQALVAGDIVGDGHELILRYDLTNTRWELLNPRPPTVGTIATQNSNNVTITGGSITGITDLAIADGGTGASTAANAFAALKQAASDTATGVVELATAAETVEKSDTSRAVTPSGLAALVENLATQATTSGTSKNFTPTYTGAKKITISLVGVSTNGTSNPLIQLGDAGGVETTGYTASAYNTSAIADYTTGFGINSGNAANVLSGQIILTLVDAATFTWSVSGVLRHASIIHTLAGTKSLSGTLTTVRLTTVNGTDAFDAGLAGCMVEY